MDIAVALIERKPNLEIKNKVFLEILKFQHFLKMFRTLSTVLSFAVCKKRLFRLAAKEFMRNY